MSGKPFYNLKELIIEKYGAEKYALGQLITAQWLTHELGEEVTVSMVEVICNTTVGFHFFDVRMCFATMKLFGTNKIFKNQK
ncbi:MAG: hypothetical protein JST02_13225 [Bacteroidetes bacterium]|nr:hypothetical protein [Bacteroidota bacterium]